LAKAILETGSIDEQYFDLCSAGNNITDDSFIERLKVVGFFSKGAKLPDSSSLIYEILRRLSSTQSMKPSEFLKKYESQLITLSKEHPNDRKYYDVLAFLYAQTGNTEKLKSLDRYGWKQLKIEKYALSYIAGFDSKTKQYKSLIREAIDDFPLSSSLNRYLLLDETHNKQDALLKFTASQFANVKNNWSGPYRLNDYMASLKHELGAHE
jgi:hypothetical protein